MQRLLEKICLFVLIGLVALRPLVPETYESAGSAVAVALNELADPTPALTLIFDVVILGCLAVWLAARAAGSPTPYRRTGLEWGLVLVVFAAAISSWVAGNRRLAINASIDWLCGVVLAITLVQLMRHRWQRRMLLAAVVASACVQAVLCCEQYLAGFDETLEHYESIKEQFWAQQGVGLDSDKVILFEGRLKAREASGSLPHSNIAGSYLVLCGFAALGVCFEWWRRCRRRRSAIDWVRAFGCTSVPALIVAAALLTKSLGALLAGLAGLIVWTVTHLLSSRIRPHRSRALVLGWLFVIGGLAAVVGHGLSRGSLPGVSLAFRWQYWRASSELIADHPLTGIGRENFGRRYLQYKPIQSPEEISNPHNLFVQASADWGLLGLAGVLAMLVGGSIAVTGRRAGAVEGMIESKPDAPHRLEKERSAGKASHRHSTIAWMVALGAFVILGRLLLLGTTDPNYLYYTGAVTGIAWLIGFAALALADADTRDEPDRGPGVITTAVAVGLFAFLLHDMINFAMFVPAAANTFFALLAYCIADRADGKGEVVALSPARRWVPAGAAAIAVLLVCAVGLMPVARMASRLHLAKVKARALPDGPLEEHPSYIMFQSASRADTLDPTPQVECARWLTAVALSDPKHRRDAWPLAAIAIDEAIRRDPFDVRLRRMQMHLFQAKAEQRGATKDYRAAIDAARSALELYPLDPGGLASLADRLSAAGQALGSKEYLSEAVERYQGALVLDDARLEWESLRRFPPGRLDQINAQIERTRDLIRSLR